MADDGDEQGGGLADLPMVVLDEVLHAVPRLVDRTRAQAELARRVAAALPCVGGLVRTDRRAAPTSDPGPPIDVLQVVALGDDEDAEPEEPAAAVASEAADATPVPDESDLPVPDYDSLAASQVVPRLTTLSADELATVGAYERAHRNRQTILNRVRQLQAG